MKPLTLSKKRSDEALNASLKTEAMKRLTFHHLASSLSTLCEFMQKSSFNSVELFDTYVKAKMTKFSGFVAENTEI
jgi:hypothetical protein